VSDERAIAKHPALERLEEWADGLLDAAAAAAVERHFDHCADCRRLAEDLRGFGEPAGEEVASAGETEASRGLLRLRILAEDLAAGEGEREKGGRERAVILPFVDKPAPPPPVANTVPFHHRSQVWTGIAAVLLAAIALGFAWDRQRQIERLQGELLAPLANTTVLEVFGENAPLRSSPPATVAMAGGVAVIVNPVPATFPKGKWRVTIEDREGRSRLDLGLEEKGGQLTFLLKPGTLPAGQYMLRIEQDGKPWPERFPLQLGDG
jgi:hypothetical protein